MAVISQVIVVEYLHEDFGWRSMFCVWICVDVVMQCYAFSRRSAIWKWSEEIIRFSFGGSQVLVKKRPSKDLVRLPLLNFWRISGWFSDSWPPLFPRTTKASSFRLSVSRALCHFACTCPVIIPVSYYFVSRIKESKSTGKYETIENTERWP